MYADKERQRETDRDRQRRYRALRKGVTPSAVVTPSVTPEFVKGMGYWVKLRGRLMTIPEATETIKFRGPEVQVKKVRLVRAMRDRDIGEFTEKYLKPMIATVAKNLDRPAHHPACKCMVCVPPKGK
jgi:hypothetical protein